MSRDSLKIQISQEFRLPILPGYIVTTDGVSIAVETFSEEQLREIGKQWTEALVKKARDRV